MRVGLTALLLIFSACSGPVGTPTTAEPTTTTLPPTSPTAEQYLAEALEIMRNNSLWSPQADWETIEEAMRSRAQGAQTIQATYEAIEVGLRLLDDPRAVFVDAESVSAFLAAAAEIEPSMVDIREDGIGHITTGQFIGDPGVEADEFSSKLARQIVEADREVCGWILDLGITRFGIPDPVLGGVAPLLDLGEVGGFAKVGGRFEPLVNEGDRILAADDVLATNSLTDIPDSGKPVAVLIGSLTGPPGEWAAVAFRGQDNVELFGQPTAGFSLWIDPFELSDGSVIALSTGEPVDRLGNTLTAGASVVPDNPTDNPTASRQAAVDWLNAQPSCQ